jgi:hypothetical protein
MGERLLESTYYPWEDKTSDGGEHHDFKNNRQGVKNSHSRDSQEPRLNQLNNSIHERLRFVPQYPFIWEQIHIEIALFIHLSTSPGALGPGCIAWREFKVSYYENKRKVKVNIWNKLWSQPLSLAGSQMKFLGLSLKHPQMGDDNGSRVSLVMLSGASDPYGSSHKNCCTWPVVLIFLKCNIIWLQLTGIGKGAVLDLSEARKKLEFNLVL